MKALQQNLSKLEGADTQVLGVSMDSPFSNFAFAQQNGVSFPILGDWGGPVTSRYGLTQKFDIQGVPIETARRATFLIDKSGKIINEQVDDEAVDPTKTVEACERQNSGAEETAFRLAIRRIPRPIHETPFWVRSRM